MANSVTAGTLPPLPTRQEVCDFCNQHRTENLITPRIVRRWENDGWLNPHPAYKWPVRYRAGQVLEFLEGRV